MDVANPVFPGKRHFAPTFYKTPATKRFKFEHQSSKPFQYQQPSWSSPNPLMSLFGNADAKRSLDPILPSAKRFRRNPEPTFDEFPKEDLDGDLQMVTEDTELDEVRNTLLQQEDILDRILGFMDTIALQRYRAVSKLWKKACDAALIGRQLVAPSKTVPWKETPRLVFDARFRVNGVGQQPWDGMFPQSSWDDSGSRVKQNLQVEFSGLAWKGSLRSLNLTDAFSNHLVNLITRNLNCSDGEYHDLKILVERGRVFLKLDQHWLPGTIPVRELAKLLGICTWKGLPWTSSESSEAVAEAEMDLMDE